MRILNKLKGQDEDTENGEDNLNTFNTRFKKNSISLSKWSNS